MSNLRDEDVRALETWEKQLKIKGNTKNRRGDDNEFYKNMDDLIEKYEWGKPGSQGS